MDKAINFTGINRAIPSQLAEDGACQEIMNMRFRKGAWRPVGTKKQHKFLPIDPFGKIYLHDVENGLIPQEPNWIGYNKATGNISLINQNLRTSTLLTSLPPNTQLNIVFLKRTMIIASEVSLLTYLWTNEGAYSLIESLPVPDVDLSTKDHKAVITTAYFAADAVLGSYFTTLDNESQDEGHLYGSLMYITAYRLFDGSYILPSIPRYFEIGNGGIIHRANPGGGSSDDRVFDFRLGLYKIEATINNELYPESIGPMKELVDAICVFATKVTPLLKIDETTVTEEMLEGIPSSEPYIDTNFNTYFPVADDFKKLIQSEGWYKIHEFPFEDVVGKTGRQTKEVDTVNYYKNYATKETLTTDQFTHHVNIAKVASVYNDRLHLANIKVSLGLPYVTWPDTFGNLGSLSSLPGKISVWVKTSVGQAVVQSTTSIPVYLSVVKNQSEYFLDYGAANIKMIEITAYPNYVPFSGYIVTVPASSPEGLDQFYCYWEESSGNNTESFIIPSVVGYNDSRAFRMQIHVTLNGYERLLFDEKLTKNTLLNFSTWTNPDFTPNIPSATANFSNITKLKSTITYPSTAPTPIALQYDPNRVQASEIQNPLIFPAKYSYQVGTGAVLALAAGSEPLSTGQFGQFPLQVFTTKGNWAMEIGSGDILYSNILPINGEVINNPDNIISIGGGVVYTTDMGLFVINGMQVTELSEVVEGDIDVDFMDLPEVAVATTNAQFVSLSDSISSVTFLEYISESVIGYDHLNKELIVSNDEYEYSYVYSFESKLWTKVSVSYSLLINAYPKLLGFNVSSCVSISEEESVFFTDCLVITRPISFQNPDMFKKIERALLRCEYTTEGIHYAGVYLFASDDLQTWRLITGKQRGGTHIKDLLVQRSWGSAKFYIIMFAGQINQNSKINKLDISFAPRLANKLR
jgi:hypothetical protein